jgi:hypothetical protein
MTVVYVVDEEGTSGWRSCEKLEGKCWQSEKEAVSALEAVYKASMAPNTQRSTRIGTCWGIVQNNSNGTTWSGWRIRSLTVQ